MILEGVTINIGINEKEIPGIRFKIVFSKYVGAFVGGYGRITR
jgi:ribosomal protein S12